MMLKKAVKAVGAALLYFGIYFVWQLLVGFWVGLSYEIYVLAVYGSDADIQTLIVEFSLKYAVHMTLVSNILTLVTYIVIFRMRKKKFCTEVGLTKLHPVNGILTVVLGISVNVLVTVIFSLIPFPNEWWEQYDSLSSTISDSAAWISMLSSVIAAPIVEEVVLRGLFYSRLKRGMPMFAAMLISSWIFGLIHGAIIWMMYASLMGVLICWIYEKYRSLTAAILFHFGFNLCGFVLGYMETIPDIVVILLSVLSVGLIVYIQHTAPGKIEFTMPNEQIKPSESESGGE
ncbi:MAG: CPBP family intramembrane metalloprotease [Clostridia bacterium]|nr:CPBP family intramembrane metalloprotease [Clostridia bacterium]